jgi:flagellar basal-body rod protein FlgC
MALFTVFDIAGSSMSAQSVRLNATASNLANASNVASTPEAAYRGKHPVFQTLMQDGSNSASAGVSVRNIIESEVPPARVYEPGHPMADGDGYIYMSNVNNMDEMIELISASRSYQNSVEVLNTSKQLMLKTLNVGR